MYTEKPYPGKFEGNRSQALAEVVYNITLDGCCDDLGDVEGYGYYAFVRGKRYGFIVSEDSNGFISVDHDPLPEAEAKWSRLQADYADWLETVESDN